MTFSVSLEFFPPKSELGQKQLQRTVDALSVYQPDFASVTYGAGGTTQIGSVNIIADLSKRLPCPVHGHLTMVNSSAERVWHNLNAFKSVGAGGYVILRGDAEGSGAQSYAFQTMGQFVTAAKHQTGQPVYVAAYPTKHPKAASMHADIQVLKAKLDTGADGAITQFFFEAHEFLRFRDLCAKAGIDKPIIPGILPFRRAASLERLAQISGMEIPAWLISGLRNAAIAGCEDLFAVSTAADTIKGLQREGVTQVHLYTMNDHAVIRELCDMFVAPGLTERQKKTSAA